MKLIILLLSALAISAQPAISIKVTDAQGVVTNSKITGAKAAAYLDSMAQFIAAQVDCTGTPQVCTPRYTDLADLIRAHAVKLAGEIEARYPATVDKTEADAAAAAVAALELKRKQRADAAKAEK